MIAGTARGHVAEPGGTVAVCCGGTPCRKSRPAQSPSPRPVQPCPRRSSQRSRCGGSRRSSSRWGPGETSARTSGPTRSSSSRIRSISGTCSAGHPSLQRLSADSSISAAGGWRSRRSRFCTPQRSSPGSLRRVGSGGGLPWRRFGRKLEERPVGTDPGVGDEDVEAPETVDRLADDLLEVGRVAHVARTRDHVFEPEVVAAAGRQPEADAGGPSICATARPSAARPGDQRGLPIQCHRSSRCSRDGYNARKRG